MIEPTLRGALSHAFANVANSLAGEDSELIIEVGDIARKAGWNFLNPQSALSHLDLQNTFLPRKYLVLAEISREAMNGTVLKSHF